jgi:hypothetical protein
MRPIKVLFVMLALGLSTSCGINHAARASDVTIDRATECVEVCQRLGMRLSAMVVMMNSAGCVCEPPTARSPSSAGGPSAAAGGTTVAAAQAAAAHAAAAAAMQAQLRQQQQAQYH